MNDLETTVYLSFQPVNFDPKIGMNFQEMSLLSYFLGSLTILHMKVDGGVMMLCCKTSRRTAMNWLDKGNWFNLNKKLEGRWTLFEVTADISSCNIL